jgi:hypothetical protein
MCIRSIGVNVRFVTKPHKTHPDLRVRQSRRLYAHRERATGDTRYTLIARGASSAADFPEIAIKTPESGDKPNESR